MKKLILIIVALLPVAVSASQSLEPEFSIRYFADVQSRAKSPVKMTSIDYAKLSKQGKDWTEEKVNAFFKSIDPKKIKFKEHARDAKTLYMLEPFKAKFTFEARPNEAILGGPRVAPISYWLIGVEKDTKK